MPPCNEGLPELADESMSMPQRQILWNVPPYVVDLLYLLTSLIHTLGETVRCV